MNHPHENTTHRRIMSDAFRIAWGHKHLWVFGLFASLAGFGGATDAFIGSYERPMPQIGSGQGWMSVSDVPFTSGAEMMVFGIIFLAFGVLAVWIMSVAIGGLVSSIRMISRGGEPTMADGIDDGKKHAWSVFGVNLATRLVALTASGLIGATAMTVIAERSVLTAVFYIGTFILFTAVLVMASICGAFATVDLVGKKRSVLQAVEDGFVVVTTHWMVCLETGLMLAISLLGLLVLMAMLIAMMSVPLIFMIVLFSLAKAQAVVFGLIALTGILLLMAFLLMMGFFGVFQTAVWTLLWHDLGEGRGKAKLNRVFSFLHPTKHK